MLMENREVQVKHVVREANQLANYKVNTTFDNETKQDSVHLVNFLARQKKQS